MTISFSTVMRQKHETPTKRYSELFYISPSFFFDITFPGFKGEQDFFYHLASIAFESPVGQRLVTCGNVPFTHWIRGAKVVWWLGMKDASLLPCLTVMYFAAYGGMLMRAMKQCMNGVSELSVLALQFSWNKSSFVEQRYGLRLLILSKMKKEASQ